MRAIAFEKTGTVTTGKLQIVEAIATQNPTEKLFQIAAALESLSEHPIGEAIAEAVKTISFVSQQSRVKPKGNGIQVIAHQSGGFKSRLHRQRPPLRTVFLRLISADMISILQEVEQYNFPVAYPAEID